MDIELDIKLLEHLVLKGLGTCQNVEVPVLGGNRQCHNCSGKSETCDPPYQSLEPGTPLREVSCREVRKDANDNIITNYASNSIMERARCSGVHL